MRTLAPVRTCKSGLGSPRTHRGAFSRNPPRPPGLTQPIRTERIDIEPRVTLSAKKVVLSASVCVPST